MTAFNRAWAPHATNAQWARVLELLEDWGPGAVLEPAQVRSSTGLRTDDANSLILGICIAGHGALQQSVYHDCCEHPVMVVPYNQAGPYRQPERWRCPECEELASLYSLRFELRAVFAEKV